MLTKTQVIEGLQNLPEEISVDDLFERFLLINKIEEARKLSKQGLSFSEEEAKEKMSRWLKSDGTK
ncbi:MAG: hypothetical protein LH473_00750 [Chitinophagales bacterium]|nr:hypothetical protein [Chitinophagales bacterium]